MVLVTKGNFQDMKQSLKFLYNRLTRIYPLYWIYTLIALMVFLIQPTWINSSQGNQVNILESVLLLPSNKLPLVQVGWSLIHEVYFYLVYFLIFLIIPENLLMYAIAAWGCIVIVMNLWLKPGNPYLDLAFNPLTIEFLSGCMLAILYFRRGGSKLSAQTLLIFAGSALIFAIMGHELYKANTNLIAPTNWWRVFLYGLPAFAITCCLIIAERVGFTFHSWLSQVGDASYSIYLSHLFTINVVGRIWTLFTVDGLYDNLLFIVVSLIAVLVVGFMSYWLIEKRLLTFSRQVIQR